jgi:two-component system chemotaxis sensor kinase CheA
MAEVDLLKYFRMEAREHLEGLNAGLLRLEQAPDDSDTIQTLFRLAHTLKGSARMVSLPEVGTVAHKMEDVLSLLRESGSAADESVISAMLAAIHTIAEMVDVIGEDEAAVDSDAAMTQLQKVLDDVRGSVETVSDQALSEVADERVVQETAPIQEPTEPGDSPTTAITEPAVSPTLSGAGDGPQVRVSLSKVDHLANLTSELVISKIRMAEHNSQLQTLSQGLLRAVRTVNEVQSWAKNGEVRRMLEGTPQGESLKSVLANARTVALGEGLKGLLADAKGQVAQLDNVASSLHEGIMDLRMLPASTLTTPLRLVVRETALHVDRRVRLDIEDNQVEIDKAVLEGIREPLAHLLRNAVDHGLESPQERVRAGKPKEGVIHLKFSRQGANLLVSVTDDGRGVDLEKVRQTAVSMGLVDSGKADDLAPEALFRLLSHPGFSTMDKVTEISGRGVGLDVVASDVKALKGSLSFTSTLGVGTSVSMRFPINLSTMEGFLFMSGYRTYAVPLEAVTQISQMGAMARGVCARQPVLKVGDESVPYVPIERFLGDSEDDECSDAVIMHWAGDRLAFGVDQVIGVRTLIVKPLADHIGNLPWVSGTTVLSNGKPAVVLDVNHLFAEATSHQSGGRSKATAPNPGLEWAPRTALEEHIVTVLVVDDSVSARMIEKGMLESGGYRVVLAADGEEGLSKVAQGGIDLVVSDVEMPRMTGLEMARRIKAQPASRDLPVIIVSSLGTDKDRRRGLDIGAADYLVKGELNQKMLLEAAERLVGKPND